MCDDPPICHMMKTAWLGSQIGTLNNFSVVTDPDEGRLFGWPGVLIIGGLTLDLLECRFQFRGRGHINAFDETMPRFILGTVRQVDPAQARQQRRHFGCWPDNDRDDRTLRAIGVVPDLG